MGISKIMTIQILFHPSFLNKTKAMEDKDEEKYAQMTFCSEVLSGEYPM